MIKINKILKPRYLLVLLVLGGGALFTMLQATSNECFSTEDGDDSTTEAVNPQAVFFIQVDNNSIVRSDNISVGDNLSSTLMQWTGSLQNSVVD